MSGNNTNSSGCTRTRRERFLSYFRNIQKCSFRCCCVPFLLGLLNHILASAILFVCFSLIFTFWFIFDVSTSLQCTLYCVALMICAGLSCTFPKGHTRIRKEEKKRQQQQSEIEVHQSSPKSVHEIEQLPLEIPYADCVIPADVASVDVIPADVVASVDVIPADVASVDVSPADVASVDVSPADVTLEGTSVIVHQAEVHIVDEFSESSKMDVPATMSSEEAVKQVVPSESRRNLRRSSTEPSTSTTPLE